MIELIDNFPKAPPGSQEKKNFHDIKSFFLIVLKLYFNYVGQMKRNLVFEDIYIYIHITIYVITFSKNKEQKAEQCRKWSGILNRWRVKLGDCDTEKVSDKYEG